mmetsp:Transcript_70271/g.124108  ORF Transcript_70271/g.124108 Transcript_70271/m.124108 type:complete len:106 (+) Transcript_70271:55-372(+)
MGILQLLVDAWAGTTALAMARRSGIFSAAKLEFIHNETARKLLKRYLEVGESSAERIDRLAEAVQKRGSSRPGPPSELMKTMSSNAQKALTGAENALRKLRERLR